MTGRWGGVTETWKGRTKARDQHQWPLSWVRKHPDLAGPKYWVTREKEWEIRKTG